MRRTTALIAAVLALALPAVAGAQSTTDRIYYDCQHSPTGYLTGSYTKAQLRHARDNPPSDIIEYSNCVDVVKQALRDAILSGRGPGKTGGGAGDDGSGPAGAGANGGGGSTGAGGSGGPAVPATPHVGTRAPVALAGVPVQPGAIPEVGRDAHALPTPLVVLLLLLGIGALAPLAASVGQRVIARRRA
jgi:hypothetical protein